MATDKNTLKNWFKTGLKPTQAQFWAWLDSYRHKDDAINQSDIEGLSITLNAKAEKLQFDSHKSDPNAHPELIKSNSNKIVRITYSDLGVPENTEITKEIMANYIASLEMPIEPNTNYYFEVQSNEGGGEIYSLFMSPITNLMHSDLERTSYFPIYLNIGGEQYVLDDNALFTDDEPGIKAFYNAYVALLNTVNGLEAAIDNTQDFNIGMESNILIRLDIDSAIFEGDFGITYADSDDYSNGIYATRGFTYDSQYATFYSKFYQNSLSEDIGSMKFFNIFTSDQFSEYNVPIDLTLLKDE